MSLALRRKWLPLFRHSKVKYIFSSAILPEAPQCLLENWELFGGPSNKWASISEIAPDVTSDKLSSDAVVVAAPFAGSSVSESSSTSEYQMRRVEDNEEADSTATAAMAQNTHKEGAAGKDSQAESSSSSDTDSDKSAVRNNYY